MDDESKYTQFAMCGGPHCGHVIVEEINKLPQTLYTTGEQKEHDPSYTNEPIGQYLHMYVLDGYKLKYVRKVYQ